MHPKLKTNKDKQLFSGIIVVGKARRICLILGQVLKLLLLTILPGAHNPTVCAVGEILLASFNMKFQNVGL